MFRAGKDLGRFAAVNGLSQNGAVTTSESEYIQIYTQVICCTRIEVYARAYIEFDTTNLINAVCEAKWHI